mmetsp:Transcript_113745/g.362921  ORF Transcript_113745/g.362921 Transcript_113745/m.362921 type:complete len:101 (-) Transcript_113745:104-406(-)
MRWCSMTPREDSSHLKARRSLAALAEPAETVLPKFAIFKADRGRYSPSCLPVLDWGSRTVPTAAQGQPCRQQDTSSSERGTDGAIVATASTMSPPSLPQA